MAWSESKWNCSYHVATNDRNSTRESDQGIAFITSPMFRGKLRLSSLDGGSTFGGVGLLRAKRARPAYKGQGYRLLPLSPVSSPQPDPDFSADQPQKTGDSNHHD